MIQIRFTSDLLSFKPSVINKNIEDNVLLKTFKHRAGYSNQRPFKVPKVVDLYFIACTTGLLQCTLLGPTLFLFHHHLTFQTGLIKEGETCWLGKATSLQQYVMS